MSFAHPYIFLLLLGLPLFIALYIYYRKSPAAFTLSTTSAFKQTSSWKVRLRLLPFILLLLAYTLMVIALARPQKSETLSNSETKGINIVMAIDISSSMLSEDLKPNRLEAAKNVASEFVSSRPNDNIGLVAFSGESFTLCPLTTDRATLLNLLNSLRIGMVTDGTAIGNGLATAITRLKDSPAKSKVIILLTDGSNNSGEITPSTAADIAHTFGIRVYTIGVGTKGMAPYPIDTPRGIIYQNIPVDIDEGTLKLISEKTGGAYFRATDNQSLEDIYKQIDQLEKSRIKVKNYHHKVDYFPPFLLFSLLALLIAALLRATIFRLMP